LTRGPALDGRSCAPLPLHLRKNNLARLLLASIMRMRLRVLPGQKIAA
jgi:hypothetical protein